MKPAKEQPPPFKMNYKKKISAKDAFIQDYKRSIKGVEKQKHHTNGKFMKMYLSADEIIDLAKETEIHNES